ncbi:MAG TPA: ATP-binding protein, partial [Gemmataceae bacterium]|nr:ATP-binding protein [Gemmataceae bacterium]
MSTDSNLIGKLRSFMRTFSFRVMLWMFIISCVMTIFTTILSAVIVRRTIHHSYEASMKGHVDHVLKTIADFVPDDSDEPIEGSAVFPYMKQTLNRITHPADWFIYLFSNDGRPIFHSEDAPALPTEASRFTALGAIVTEKELSWITVPYPPTGSPLFHVVVGRTERAMRDDLSWLNFTLWLRGFFGLAVAPIVGYLVARQVTITMLRIITTAKRLEPENLSERLPIRGTGDEMDLLSQTINGLLDRVAGYIERHRVFVANAAHELRSPLAAMRSSTEVALNFERTPAEYSAVLGDLVGEVDQLSTMVNRLLLLAESDAGRFEPTGQRSRLDALVRETVEMFVPVAESQDVELRVEELPAVEVRADDSALRHVLRNLIDNAIKFSTPATAVQVSLRTERIDGKEWAILDVVDQGIGISPEDLPRLFERFFRGDKARDRSTRRSGSGLGLSICHSIVTALKGD